MASALVHLMSLLAAPIPTPSLSTAIPDLSGIAMSNPPLATQTAQGLATQTGLGGGFNTIIQPPQNQAPTASAPLGFLTTVAPSATRALDTLGTSSTSSSILHFMDQRRDAEPQLPGIAVPPAVPSAPKLPAIPNVGTIASLPAVPGIPSVPSVPIVPSIQALSNPAVSAPSCQQTL